MKIDGRHYRTSGRGWRGVEVIDQTKLPFASRRCASSADGEAAEAIRTMVVRGAPLIGATAAYGVALAMRADAVRCARSTPRFALLGATRPTAVNLRWALARMRGASCGRSRRRSAPTRAYAEAAAHRRRGRRAAAAPSASTAPR